MDSKTFNRSFGGRTITHATLKLVCANGHHTETELHQPEEDADGHINGYAGSDASFCSVCGNSVMDTIGVDATFTNTGFNPRGVSPEEAATIQMRLRQAMNALDACAQADLANAVREIDRQVAGRTFGR